MSRTLPPLSREKVKRWTKSQYIALIEKGAFHDERVYLFRGDIIQMAPQNFPHQWTVTKLNRVLFEAFGDIAEIRIQSPLEVPDDSIPEPDGAVCTAEQLDRRPCPASALLVVEVSDTSLPDDRAKAMEYAAAGVPEYWIVDLNRRQIEVYRDPIADAGALLGWRYATQQMVSEDESISPIARPDTSIAANRLFPPQ